MSNHDDVDSAIVEMLKILNPRVHEILVDVYGVDWWERGVKNKIESSQNKDNLEKDLRRLSRYNDKKKIQSLDITLISKILYLNQRLFDGKSTSEWQCYDDRFFNLIEHIRFIRNLNSHLGTQDLSNSKREDCIRCVYEVCGYFTDNLASLPPISNNKVYDNGNAQLSSEESIKTQTAVVNPEPRLPPVSGDKEVVSNTNSQIHIEWIVGPGHRYGAYSDGDLISKHAAINSDGSLSPLDTLESFNGTAFKSYKDGSYYKGCLVNGLCTGFGIRYGRSGKTLKGLFVEEEYIGSVYINGNEVSELDDNAYDDVKIVYTSGGFYEGRLKGFKPNGFGTYVGPDRGKITGYFLNGNLIANKIDGVNPEELDLNEYEGIITLHLKNMIYSGGWSKGVKCGKAVVEVIGDFKYRGDWKYDCQDGEGAIEYSTGDRYDGGFDHGRFSGYGKYRWKDGTEYSGHYYYGLRSGEGTMTTDKGILQGNWAYDSPHGDFVVTDPSGKQIYKGSCKHGTFGCVDNAEARDILNSMGFVVEVPPVKTQQTVINLKKSTPDNPNKTYVPEKSVFNWTENGNNNSTWHSYDSSNYIGDRNPAYER